MKALLAFVCGLIFALGLGISGMTQPAKVLSFLDIAGDWDPSLAFVMVGAIAVYALGYRWITKRAKPLAASHFDIPARRKIDRRLLAGSFLFGVGWGLSGYCPGPALTSLGTLRADPIIFVASLLLGMFVYEEGVAK